MQGSGKLPSSTQLSSKPSNPNTRLDEVGYGVGASACLPSTARN